jgi:hypothetical protein
MMKRNRLDTPLDTPLDTSGTRRDSEAEAEW